MLQRLMLREFGVPLRYCALSPHNLRKDEWCGNLADHCMDPDTTTWGFPGWMVISAGPGRGKTSWLTSVFNGTVKDKLSTKPELWLSDQGPRRPIWVNELHMHMTMGLRGASPGGRSVYLQALAKAPLLMLDDIGAGTSSEFKRTALQYIIGERYNGMRRTLITTSLTPEELFGLLGKAASSRLLEMCGNIWRIKGPDHRA